MKSLSKLVLILILISDIRCEPDICKESADYPEIVEAFRVENQVFVMTKSLNIYRMTATPYDPIVKDIRIDPNSIVKQTSQGWDQLQKMKLFFPVRYPDDSGPLRLFGIAVEERDGISGQMVGYVIELKTNTWDVVLPLKEYELNFYKYKPDVDPLGLMNLLKKFPQKNIENYMLSILPFPIEPTHSIPGRMFVYFLERPINIFLGSNGIDFEFKRHIMIKENINFGTPNDEINWKHDRKSQKCIQQNVVNASFTLTDKYLTYQSSTGGQQLYFDLLEFSYDKYLIKRVNLRSDLVSEDLLTIKEGFIANLFNCTPKLKITTTTTSATTRSRPTRTRTPRLTTRTTTALGESSTSGGGGDTSAPQPPNGGTSSPKPGTLKPKSKSHLWIYLSVGAVVILLVIGVVLFFFWRSLQNGITGSTAAPQPSQNVESGSTAPTDQNQHQTAPTAKSSGQRAPLAQSEKSFVGSSAGSSADVESSPKPKSKPVVKPGSTSGPKI